MRFVFASLFVTLEQFVIKMADVSAAPAKAAPKKKVSKPKVPAAHPKYSEMVSAAVAALKERGGSSRQAILKYICAHYKVGDEKSVNAHLKMALRAGVKNNSLKQSKGAGASGSFRLGEAKKAKSPKKKAAKKTTSGLPKLDDTADALAMLLGKKRKKA